MSSEIHNDPVVKFSRFLGTGLLAAVIGITLFFGFGLFLLFLLDDGSFGGGTLPDLWVWCLLALVYLICFIVPWLVSGFTYACGGRWACPLAYGLTWGFLWHLAKEAQHVIPLMHVLLGGAVLPAFIGGDLGDRRRKYKEQERMKVEAELAEQEYEEHLADLSIAPRGGE